MLSDERRHSRTSKEKNGINVQSAVHAEHAVIVAHEVVLDSVDSGCLQLMAEAAKAFLGLETLRIVPMRATRMGSRLAAEAFLVPWRSRLRGIRAKGVSEAEHIGSDQPIDLLILCHFSMGKDCQSILEAVETLRPSSEKAADDRQYALSSGELAEPQLSAFAEPGVLIAPKTILAS